MLLGNLPSSILAFTLALAATALPVSSTTLKQLTAKDFDTSVATGAWFIEFFSPHCSHCQQFAPTWEKLVEAQAGNTGVNLAQVNCITQGDLCNEKNVKYYPMLRLYKDGKLETTFEEKRELSVLNAFLEKHVPSTHDEPGRGPPPRYNLDGKVLALDAKTFPQALADGPVFVKFFAPWCGHCKKLAPTWADLADHMKGKLTIAEVNCEDHGSVCRNQGIQGYPTLIFYQNGQKVEYTGARSSVAFERFVAKAISPAVEQVTLAKFDTTLQKEEVLYLLLHGHGDKDAVHAVEEAAKPLLGSPTIVRSSDMELFTKFRHSASDGPILLTLKDHLPESVASLSLSPLPPVSDLTSFLFRHKFPTVVELNVENFADIMKSPSLPYIVLVALDTAERTKEQLQKHKEVIHDIATSWREQGGSQGRNRETVFVWMDGERWGSWLKKMYGVQKEHMPAVIIVDHRKLQYYNVDPTGAAIRLSHVSLASSLEGVYSGTLPYKYSENIFERALRSFHDGFMSVMDYVVLHPWWSLLFAIASLVVVYHVLQRLIEEDVPRGSYPVLNKEGSRLD